MTASSPAACAILIPAFDEAERVGAVVSVAREADLGPVVVIDDGSRDGTCDAARAAGAEVVRLDANRGKAAAVLAGASLRREAVVVLLDADLVGLRPEHVAALAAPVLEDGVDMTRGIFAGGRWATTAAQRLAPVLGGQRALRRELLAAIGDADASGFGLEVRLERAARRGGWRRRDVELPGVSQVMKEEKRGWWPGLKARFGMYRDVLAALWSRGRA